MQSIATTRPHVVYEQPLSRDVACQQPLEAGMKLDFLTHGSMVYCRVDPATCADQSINSQSVVENDDRLNDSADNAANIKPTNMRRVIGKDGSIILVPSNELPAEKDKGFRKGMMALRDMKMHWTCKHSCISCCRALMFYVLRFLTTTGIFWLPRQWPILWL